MSVGGGTGTGNTTPLLVVLVIGKPVANTGIVMVPLTVLEIGEVGQGLDVLLDGTAEVNWVVAALKAEVEDGRIGVGIQTLPIRTLVIGKVVGPDAQIGIALVPLKVVPIGAVGTTNEGPNWELPFDEGTDELGLLLETAAEEPGTFVEPATDDPGVFVEPPADETGADEPGV